MPKTVLLADDSLTIQRVVALTFANEDVTIVPVSDGDQAVDSISRSAPDLVLADIGMPGRTGYQVAEFVRSQPTLGAVPVLLLAGAFEPVDEAQARRVGADGVLTKPFEPAVLIGQVNQLLARGRREARSASPIPAATPASVTAPSPAAVAAERPSGDSAGPVADMPAAIPPMSRQEQPDSYFDQIDQAFAALAKTPRPPLTFVAKPTSAAEDAGETDQSPRTLPVEPVAAPAPAATLATEPMSVPNLMPLEAPTLTPDAVTRDVGFTDAFAALLDAERAGIVTTVMRPVAAAPAVDVEALASQVAKRVLEQLSDRVVRETVTDIVTTTAERLVREEIEQVKRNIP